MRAQSSIEFLSVYGFMFIVIAIVIAILAFITVSPLVYSPSQCNAFSGPYCAFVQLYSNSSGHFSLYTFVLTNTQSVPINITSFNVTVHGISSSSATCTPSYLVPGQSADCVAFFHSSPPLATYVQGFYYANATYCNSGLNGVFNSNCVFVKTNYSGSFATPAEPSLVIPVTMLALQGPKNVQLAPYSTVPILPNYQVIQSGFLSMNLSNKVFEYAFGTPDYIGNIYLGLKVAPFPNSVNSLNNYHVACGYPFNSTYSIFATTLYLTSPARLNVSIVTDNAMEVYYKPSTASSWASAFNGAAWHGQGATQYTNNGVVVGSGLYNLEILWSNICAPGVQVLKISNFSSSV